MSDARIEEVELSTDEGDFRNEDLRADTKDARLLEVIRIDRAFEAENLVYVIANVTSATAVSEITRSGCEFFVKLEGIERREGRKKDVGAFI